MKTETFTRDIGDKGESLAKAFLEKEGLTFVEQNFTTKTGEIDLIMKEKQAYIFVEVRLRQVNDYVSALESITPQKQNRIKRTVILYLQQQALMDKVDCRIDVIAITQHNDTHEIEWIKNAIFD